MTFSAEGAEADFSARDVASTRPAPSSASHAADGPKSGAGVVFRPSAGRSRCGRRCRGTSTSPTRSAPSPRPWRWGSSRGPRPPGLASAGRVPGRLEPIDEGQAFAVLVDYAHTPDSLENVLRAARRLTEGRVISVFGAGGDRDRDKRPKMGRAASRGLRPGDRHLRQPALRGPGRDRRRSRAPGPRGRTGSRSRSTGAPRSPSRFERARPGDTVVIAGKGHEQGQEFEDGRKIPFDDREVAREELERLGGGG